MAKHKIQLTYDDSDDTLVVTHRCSVDVGEHTVSHAEPVELADTAGAAAMLRSLIDANRDDMEKRTHVAAIQHAAAMAGQLPPNTKALKAGGSLGAVGGAATKKEVTGP